MRLFEIVKPSVYKDALLNKMIELSKEHGLQDMYVTFTEMDNFAINDGTLYNTPVGLYAYPLSYVLRQRIERVPFAKYAKFVWVFKASVPPGGVWNMTDDDENIIANVANSTNEVTGITSPPAKSNKKAWKKMYVAIGKKAKPNEEVYGNTNRNQGVSAQAVMATKILKNAGVHAVIDPGTGTIHRNEKNQSVFLYIDELDVVKKYINTFSSDQKAEKKLAHNNAEVPFKKRLEAATHARKRDEALEKLPIPASVKAYELSDYIEYTGKNKWPSAEERIAKDARAAARYAARVLPGRFKQGEQAISKNAMASFDYARTVIRDRWPPGEPTIAKDPWQATMYAMYVLKSRWPAAEDTIMSHRQSRTKYKELFGDQR